MNIHDVEFGAQLTLNCSHENGTEVKWYFNNDLVNVENSSSVLQISFNGTGIYRCDIVTDQMETFNKTVQLCGVGEYTLFKPQ